jgi:hypothetical protein
MRPHANMVKCPYRWGDFDRSFQDLTAAAETSPGPLPAHLLGGRCSSGWRSPDHYEIRCKTRPVTN